MHKEVVQTPLCREAVTKMHTKHSRGRAAPAAAAAALTCRQVQQDGNRVAPGRRVLGHAEPPDAAQATGKGLCTRELECVLQGRHVDGYAGCCCGGVETDQDGVPQLWGLQQ